MMRSNPSPFISPARATPRVRIESTDLWRLPAGHINSRSLDVLRKVKDNGAEYNGEPQKCDACAIDKSAQQLTPYGNLMMFRGPSSWLPRTTWGR